MDIKYGRLMGGILEETESFKYIQNEHGHFIKAPKDFMDLMGYKQIVYDEYPVATAYENLIMYYDDTQPEALYVRYRVERKLDQEITTYNTNMWNNLFLPIQLTDKTYYTPKNTLASVGNIPIDIQIANIESSSLSAGDKNSLLQELYTTTNTITAIEVYNEPDMLAEITPEYISSLKVIVTEYVELYSIMNAIESLKYSESSSPMIV